MYAKTLQRSLCIIQLGDQMKNLKGWPFEPTGGDIVPCGDNPGSGGFPG